jgi:hypothetical protein
MPNMPRSEGYPQGSEDTPTALAQIALQPSEVTWPVAQETRGFRDVRADMDTAMVLSSTPPSPSPVTPTL